MPNEFSKKKHIESIKGIYVPFWLFDCEAYADITYKTTRTSYWSDSKYNYTKTDHYMVKRGGSLAFEKIAKSLMNVEASGQVRKRGMAAFFSHIVTRHFG